MLPDVKALGGIIHIDWPQLGIYVELASLHRNREHAPIAVATVWAQNSTGRMELSHGHLNLLSSRSQSDLIRALKERYTEAPWLELIPTLCYQGEKKFNEGEAVAPIRHRTDMMPPEYLVYPLLALNKPSIIYGLGGSGKSILADALALIVATGYRNNPLHLAPKYTEGNVLILDYEADQDEIEWRINCLMRGMDMPAETFDIVGTSIDYRHLSIPVADDIEEINRLTLERGYKLIIVDSIGAAVGGDLNITEGPNRLFPALRQLKTTILLIGHTAKNQQGKTSPYGNAYYFNYARSIWELKKVQESGEDSLCLGLFHRKANASKLHQRIGFEMTFGKAWVKFKTADIREMPGFEAELTLKDRVWQYLKDGTKADVKEIAIALEAGEGSVKTTLNRMAQHNAAMHFPDGWALLAKA